MEINYDGKPDAEELKKAMEGPKKDEETIIKIIANRTNQQRQKIKQDYQQLYNRDIITDLKAALKGKFEDAVVALFYTPIDYDCFQLRKAMKGLGTDEATLIEILTTRPCNTIQEIKNRYPIMFPGRDLTKDVYNDTSGNFRKMLMALLEANRSNNKKPDEKECKECAIKLYEAGEKKLGTDEKVFINIFTTKSPNEIDCIARIYFKMTKHTLLQAVESEFSFDSKKCLIAILYAMLSQSEFFAKKINKAIKGLGTDNNTLIRILVSRDEVDMPLIKQFYRQIYKKDMIEDIKNDTSGNYRNLLVELASH